MAESNSLILLPEILLKIARFLEIDDRISALQVNKFWNRTLQSTVPSGTLSWKDNLPENELESIYNSLCNDSIRTFECQLKSFEGKSLYYMKDRAVQQKRWEPVKEALRKGKGPMSDSPDIQVQKFVAKGGTFLVDDFFYIVLESKTLKHFWLDSLPGRNTYPDISKIFYVLGRPTSQSLRALTIKNSSWPNTLYPSNVRCKLRKISLENTPCSDQNLVALLASCPLLEELEVIESVSKWGIFILQNIPKSNPLLKSFIISSTSSFSNTNKLDDIQVNYIFDYLKLDLTTLGLYRLGCTPEVFARLLNQYKNLTRLEIYESFDGKAVHDYLSVSPQLRHLVARDVVIPLSLLQDKFTAWSCKDLLTLEISFDESSGGQVEDSKVIFEYLAEFVPNIQTLRIQKKDLSLRQGQGVELLRGLKHLKELTIVSGSIESSEADNGSDLAELRALVRKLSLQPFEVKQQ